MCLLINHRLYGSRVQAVPVFICQAFFIDQIHLLELGNVLVLHFFLFAVTGRDVLHDLLMNTKHMLYYIIYLDGEDGLE